VSSRSKIITLIIVLALTIYAGISLYNFWGHHVAVLRTLDDMRAEVSEMQQKIDDLEFMIEHRDDPDVMRRIAEELLGLVSPDELVFMLENLDDPEVVRTTEELWDLIYPDEAMTSDDSDD